MAASFEPPVDRRVAQLFALVTEALAGATQALLRGEIALGSSVIEGDALIDKLTSDVEKTVWDQIDAESPSGEQLRRLIGILQILPELERSAETLRLAADLFVKHKVKAAIEPIRSAETSLVHTVADAKAYIAAVNHPGVKHINGDVYHMQAEESHIGEAIVDAGEMLVNLHMADSNRAALGQGSMDLDTIIRALYVIGYNTEGRYVTPEPLGPGGDPYPAMYGKPDGKVLEALVQQTARCFREREEEVLTDT